MSNQFDPHLHILRSIIRALPEARMKQESLEARSKLYIALESGKLDQAVAWATALRLALVSAGEQGVNRELIDGGLAALKIIEEGITK